MPFIVSWPGVTEAGSKNVDLVQNLDYAPTFLEMAGAKVPADMQGKSLVPLLKGQQPKWRDAIYYHYYEYPSVHMVPRHNGVRTRDFKLMHFYQFGDEWEFYDLRTDPGELTNQYDNPYYADEVATMKKKLVELIKMYGDDSDMAEKDDAWKAEMRQ